MKINNNQYITPKEATELAGVSHPTIIRWIKQYGIGKKVMSHFFVDKQKFLSLLEGEDLSKEQENGKKKKNGSRTSS